MINWKYLKFYRLKGKNRFELVIRLICVEKEKYFELHLLSFCLIIGKKEVEND